MIIIIITIIIIMMILIIVIIKINAGLVSEFVPMKHFF